MSLPLAQVVRAKHLVDDWLPLYPNDREIPWISAKARAVRAESEDEWLSTFRDSTALTLAQVKELIDWKWVLIATETRTRLAGSRGQLATRRTLHHGLARTCRQ